MGLESLTEAILPQSVTENQSTERRSGTMPIYVYECDTCKDIYEVEQRIIEDALTDCIRCEKGKIKRVIQPVGVAFKGSGFYVNDVAGKSSSLEKSEPAPAPKPTPESKSE